MVKKVQEASTSREAAGPGSRIRLWVQRVTTMTSGKPLLGRMTRTMLLRPQS